MKEILLKVREELEKKFDEKTKNGSQHFFKEKVKVIGVKASDVQKISKEVFKFFKLNEKAHIFDLCEKLWQSGYLEESFIACNWVSVTCSVLPFVLVGNKAPIPR